MSAPICCYCNKKCRQCQVCHNRTAGFIKDDKIWCCLACNVDNLPAFANETAMCQVCKKTRKCYGPPNGKKLRCGHCKIEGDILLSQKSCVICAEQGKFKIPVFGNPNSKIAAHCKDHKLADEVDVKNRKCIVCKQKTASYGIDKKLEYCKSCANDLNIQVKQLKVPMCIICNQVTATFGRIGSTIPQYCLVHIPEDKTNYENVRSKRCEHDDCSIQPHWGLRGSGARWCVKHAPDEAVKVTCLCKQCLQASPNWGQLHDERAQRCFSCKLDDDIRFYGHKCPSCSLPFSIKPDIKCSYCDGTRAKRTCEMDVLAFMLQHFSDYVITHNKSIGADCDSFRPDILIDIGTYFIIIEVDERQHKYRDKSCEIRRINTCAFALGLPTKIIRYNPHKYRDRNGTQVDIPATDRKDCLKRLIREILETELDQIDFSEIVYMFYDEKLEVVASQNVVVNKPRTTVVKSTRSAQRQIVAIKNDAPVLRYESIDQAAKAMKCDSKTIRQVLDKSGRGKGFQWVTFDPNRHQNVPMFNQV